MITRNNKSKEDFLDYMYNHFEGVYKSIFDLRFNQNKKYKEIANALNFTEYAVGGYIKNIKKILISCWDLWIRKRISDDFLEEFVKEQLYDKRYKKPIKEIITSKDKLKNMLKD